ncbi:MAG: signal peptidase I [Candidatus Promineifilaceae bacterium]|nr:signal peptidase I [Candidatus Promineifilaceae bacterium]
MSSPNRTEPPPSLGSILRHSISRGNSPHLSVISDSMSPLLRAGDTVKLAKLDPSHLRRGTIITFDYPSEPVTLITHRYAGQLHSNGQKRLITWADRTLMFDSPIELSSMIGCVVSRTRNDQELNIQHGKGAWLSKKLSKLATRELKWITKLDLVQDQLTEKVIANSDEKRRRSKTKIGVRLLRRANYAWALLLTKFVEFLP